MANQVFSARAINAHIKVYNKLVVGTGDLLAETTFQLNHNITQICIRNPPDDRDIDHLSGHVTKLRAATLRYANHQLKLPTVDVEIPVTGVINRNAVAIYNEVFFHHVNVYINAICI